MRDLLRRIYSPGLSVLDVGSRDVNGTYRPIVEGYGMKYTGLDAEAGPNVDLISSAYDLPMCQFDIVISGQTLEHLTQPHKAVEEMKRVCRPGGWVVLIAPFTFVEHRYPIDCWRFLPDGMRFMLAGFEDVESQIVNMDCYGIGRKPCGPLAATA